MPPIFYNTSSSFSFSKIVTTHPPRITNHTAGAAIGKQIKSIMPRGINYNFLFTTHRRVTSARSSPRSALCHIQSVFEGLGLEEQQQATIRYGFIVISSSKTQNTEAAKEAPRRTTTDRYPLNNKYPTMFVGWLPGPLLSTRQFNNYNQIEIPQSGMYTVAELLHVRTRDNISHERFGRCFSFCAVLVVVVVVVLLLLMDSPSSDNH